MVAVPGIADSDAVPHRYQVDTGWAARCSTTGRSRLDRQRGGETDPNRIANSPPRPYRNIQTRMSGGRPIPNSATPRPPWVRRKPARSTFPAGASHCWPPMHRRRTCRSFSHLHIPLGMSSPESASKCSHLALPCWLPCSRSIGCSGALPQPRLSPTATLYRHRYPGTFGWLQVDRTTGTNWRHYQTPR